MPAARNSFLPSKEPIVEYSLVHLTALSLPLPA
jgi:hypothetical protein